MNRTQLPSLRLTLVGLTATLLCVGSLSAQQAAPAATVQPFRAAIPTVELGHSTVEGTVYTLLATQPADSKLTGQRLRLLSTGSTGSANFTHRLDINTGKYKTVSQLESVLADIFKRFLAKPAPGAVLGKIGDVRYGGEMNFVAESPDKLRVDLVTPGATDSTGQFGRADAQAFLSVMDGAAKQ